MASSTAIRCLLACDGCRRQFDVAGFAPTSRFHCSCGRILTVPEFKPHAAAIVRCSSCGAPRTAGSSACEHCRADYTLHEQDLQTVCPACMTLVPDRARFCHGCGVPIAPQGAPGAPSSSRCPTCGKRQRLNSRDLGDPPVAVLECPSCAGVWLSNEVFDLLATRARDRAAEPDGAARGGSAARAAPSAAAKGPLYRKCPACDQRMNRRNFGRRSGVILDVCGEHGTWFDARELEAVLGWIRDGGEARSRERDGAEQRAAERAARFEVDWASKAGHGDGSRSSEAFGWGDGGIDLVSVLRRVFDI